MLTLRLLKCKRPRLLSEAVLRSFVSSAIRQTSQPVHETPILIVGGGPSGLFLANLLQVYGANFTLLEAQDESRHFHHPQAHFLNTRTMELLKHATPRVYERVRESMPPVKEWNRFIFGCHMTTKNPMAIVEHPVASPLRANQNANGVLLDASNHSPSDHNSSERDMLLSDTSVGHLAQHTFNRILFEEAIANQSQESRTIHFGSKVVDAQYNPEDRNWNVTTDKGQQYRTPVVVAADGARSAWRQQYLGIAMSGKPAIQHLINVHFSLLEEPSEDLLPPAMLYTVFSSQVLSMVVRHSPMDYVMQIPYFPPYQTVEETFTNHKVEIMVQAALGSSSQIPFRINSIRPWTMGSLVAESFADRNVYLVGDAAHVFPPAGGFGMNTGLQDVASLAWRLVLQDNTLHREKQYTKERQQVAGQNAALSVRNYERVLGVMQSCYLDHRNLPILLKTLDASKDMGMPFSVLKKTFQNLFEAALMPLQILKDSPQSPIAQHLTNNLRKLLGSGQGLPLLFPEYEVSFTYNKKEDSRNFQESSQDLWTADSWAQTPHLAEGRLFPHLVARLLSKATSPESIYPRLALMSDSDHNCNAITTRDLPFQLSSSSRPCTFALVEVSHLLSKPISIIDMEENKKTLAKARSEMKAKLEVPVAALQLYIEHHDCTINDDKSEAEKALLHATADSEDSVLSAVVSAEDWNTLDINGDGSWSSNHPLWILIRPDGHVSSIIEADISQLNALIAQGKALLSGS